MIKALLVILAPTAIWERIALSQRKWLTLFLTYFLPLLLLVSAVEGYGLVRLGKPRGLMDQVRTFSVKHAVIYESAYVLLTIAALFIVARQIKSLGDTFHGRHSLDQAFTIAAYGFGPWLFARLFDVFPLVPGWITWLIGMALAASVLYHGIPPIMKPDPPHALGLYFMSLLLLIITSGLVRFVMDWWVRGKFTKLDDWISKFAT